MTASISRTIDVRPRRKGIGYLPQEPSIFRGLTVEQKSWRSSDARPECDRAPHQAAQLLAELGLTPLAQAAAYTLSAANGGAPNHARAGDESALHAGLAEPFAGIDPIAVSEIQKIIFHLKERGIGILITDHNVLQTLKITDRAYIVTDGAIFRSGTPAELAADEEVRRIYLGTDFRLD